MYLICDRTGVLFFARLGLGEAWEKVICRETSDHSILEGFPTVQVACSHSDPEVSSANLRQTVASGTKAEQALAPVLRETCGQVLHRRGCVGFGQIKGQGPDGVKRMLIMGRLRNSKAQTNQVRKAEACYRLGQRFFPSLESEGEDLAGMRDDFRRVCLKNDNHDDAHAENIGLIKAFSRP